jgi:hypothetical protein
VKSGHSERAKADRCRRKSLQLRPKKILPYSFPTADGSKEAMKFFEGRQLRIMHDGQEDLF